jgi:hypothetical protein
VLTLHGQKFIPRLLITKSLLSTLEIVVLGDFGLLGLHLIREVFDGKRGFRLNTGCFCGDIGFSDHAIVHRGSEGKFFLVFLCLFRVHHFRMADGSYIIQNISFLEGIDPLERRTTLSIHLMVTDAE